MTTTLTRRTLIRRALAGAGTLVLAARLPQAATAADLCPYCGVAPYGPLHAHLHATSPAPIWADQIIARESTWEPGATNPKSGAAGLCQFLPEVWDWLVSIGLAYGSPYDPVAAIDAMNACLREGWYDMWACTVESGCA
jgi:hypothetical protein